MFTYALDQIPFSRRGSFLTITSRNSSGSPRLLYKTCSGRIHNLHDIPFPAEEFFELSMIKDGQEVPYTWQAYPHRLDLNGETGEQIVLIFADSDTLIFQANNVGFRLMPAKVFPIQFSPVEGEIYLSDWFAAWHSHVSGRRTFICKSHNNPHCYGNGKTLGEYPFYDHI